MYIAAFDVCIIPYKDNTYIQHSFSMKLFQYFALGKPVVATEMPSLQPYKPYMYIVKNNLSEFVSTLQKALNENPEKRSLRIQLARKHSWDIRAQEIFYLLTNQSCKTQ